MAELPNEDERFDASQYAFFGGNVSQEVELGGLEEDNDGVLCSGFEENDGKYEDEKLDMVLKSDDASADISEITNSYTNLRLSSNKTKLEQSSSSCLMDEQLKCLENGHKVHTSKSVLEGDCERGTRVSIQSFDKCSATIPQTEQHDLLTNVSVDPNYVIPSSSFQYLSFLNYGQTQIPNHPCAQSHWMSPDMHPATSGQSVQGHLQQHPSPFSENRMQIPPGHPKISTLNLQQSVFSRASYLDFGDARRYNGRSYKQGVCDSTYRSTGRQQFRSKLMSAEEIENIARIQLPATYGAGTYVDDYYDQAIQSNIACRAVHGGNSFAPSHLQDLKTHRHVPAVRPTFVPVDGLGKVPFSTLRRPRSLYEFDDSSVEAGINEGFLVPLEQEPMLAARIAIENGLCFLLNVDDIDRFLSATQPVDGGAQLTQLMQERQNILESLATLLQLVDPSGVNSKLCLQMGENDNMNRDGFVFLRLVVSLLKGRKMVCRYLKVLPHGSRLVQIVCIAIFRHLHFLFGVMQTNPTAAGVTTELSRTVANCITRMNLSSLSACLAAVVLSSEPPPLRPFGSGSGDEGSVLLKSILDRATALLTNSGIIFPLEDRATWQTTFDHFFHLLFNYCTSKFDGILHSVAISSPAGLSFSSIKTVAAGIMSKEMPVELLRSGLPHMNEYQRKSLLEFTQRSIGAGGLHPQNNYAYNAMTIPG